VYTLKNSLTVDRWPRRTAPTLLIMFAILLLTCPMSNASPLLPPGNAVQQWNTIAENTVVGSGAFQAEGFIYMAYVSAAVYDAVVSRIPNARQLLSHSDSNAGFFPHGGAGVDS
jgi:hypothetical protein